MEDSITNSGNSSSLLNSNLNSILTFIQINLKKSKLASANLIAFMVENNIKVALIQEPWVRNEKIKGLNHKEFVIIYKAIPGTNPRSCILIHKSITAFIISNFSDADTTVIKIEGVDMPITVVSAYFHGDLDIPTLKMVELVESLNLQDSSKINTDVLMGFDANARSELWGSSELNDRGELLTDFIIKHNLVICNRGRTPTFTFPPGENSEGWSEVLDVTLTSNSDRLKVNGWEVSRDNSYSVS